MSFSKSQSWTIKSDFSSWKSFQKCLHFNLIWSTPTPTLKLTLLARKIIDFQVGSKRWCQIRKHDGSSYFVGVKNGANLVPLTPLFFWPVLDSKWHDFRVGVPHFILHPKNRHLNAKFSTTLLCTDCDQILLRRSKFDCRHQEGSTPTFQSRGKKVGSFQWCHLKVSYLSSVRIRIRVVQRAVNKLLDVAMIN